MTEMIRNQRKRAAILVGGLENARGTQKHLTEVGGGRQWSTVVEIVYEREVKLYNSKI